MPHRKKKRRNLYFFGRNRTVKKARFKKTNRGIKKEKPKIVQKTVAMNTPMAKLAKNVSDWVMCVKKKIPKCLGIEIRRTVPRCFLF